MLGIQFGNLISNHIHNHNNLCCVSLFWKCNTNVLWYFSRLFLQSKDGLIWTMFESPNVDSKIQGTLGLPKFPKQKLNLESQGVPPFDSHIFHMGECFHSLVFTLHFHPLFVLISFGII